MYFNTKKILAIKLHTTDGLSETGLVGHRHITIDHYRSSMSSSWHPLRLQAQKPRLVYDTIYIHLYAVHKVEHFITFMNKWNVHNVQKKSLHTPPAHS